MSRHAKPVFPVRLLVIAALYIIGLTGCTTTQVPLTKWQNHRQALINITHFTAKGKVALISPNQRIPAYFIWEQQDNIMSLRLTNFLGATLFKLDVTPEHAILTDNEGQRYVGKNAASLLQQITGVALPVNSMTQWIKGLPADNNTFQLGTDNRLAYLSENNSRSNQQGWQLEYQTYDAATNSLLPEKINMTQNQQKVNLVISDWKYTP